MNKSTPLNQLPSAGAQTQFVNDQQRQFVTQAQQAIGNSPMPQNTQLSADVLNDDDAVVQDILNQINASTGGGSHTSGPMPPSSPPAHAMRQPSLEQMMQPIAVPPMYMQPSMNFDTFMAQAAAAQAQAQNQLQMNPPEMKDYLFKFTDDIKLAGLVFVIVLIVHFVPIDAFVGRYFAVDKIPYHKIILRASLAALLVVVIKKLAKI